MSDKLKQSEYWMHPEMDFEAAISFFNSVANELDRLNKRVSDLEDCFDRAMELL